MCGKKRKKTQLAAKSTVVVKVGPSQINALCRVFSRPTSDMSRFRGRQTIPLLKDVKVCGIGNWAEPNIPDSETEEL